MATAFSPYLRILDEEDKMSSASLILRHHQTNYGGESMDNQNKALDELIASLQSKIDNIAASVNSMEEERVSKKQAEEAAAAQKAQEEHETQLKAAWEEEFKKKYGITAEAPNTNTAGGENQAPETNTTTAEIANPSNSSNPSPVGLTPTVKVQENTPTYKTVDEIIAEQRAKRNRW